MRKDIKRAGLLAVVLAAMLLSGCSTQRRERSGLQGAWALKKIMPLDDSTREYHVALFRIYDEDGMMYEYQLLPPEEGGEVLFAGDMKSYTFIDKGGGEFLYLEGNKQCMLEMPNDTTMVTQQFGMLYTWTHLNTLSDSRIEEIKRIVSQDLNNKKTERHILPQEEANHTLIYIIIIIAAGVALAVSYFFATKKLKRRMRQKMRQLDEERTRLKEESEERQQPMPLNAELSEAEKEFMQSAYYVSLQHRLATGRRMKEMEWEEIEERLSRVYPNFAGTLRGLGKMSETEWQVCMLIKLRVAPTEIAKVMNKDVSSISSIRKRLFLKVFGKKGKPKEWDDYILSL